MSREGLVAVAGERGRPVEDIVVYDVDELWWVVLAGIEWMGLGVDNEEKIEDNESER